VRALCSKRPQKTSPIQGFVVTGNRLRGSFPQGFSECPGLQRLDLSENSLTGSLPPGSVLTRMSTLGSLLLGGIPWGQDSKELFALPGIANVNLSSNAFGGRVPPLGCNADAPQLATLDLSHNRLTGDLTTTLKPTLLTCTYLQILSLANNSFTGRIPRALLGLPAGGGAAFDFVSAG